MRRKKTYPPTPLLERMLEIDRAVKKRFPLDDYGLGMGKLGLCLMSRLERDYYPRTPKNALTFAATGGGGVHFSLVEIDGTVSDDSPVVMTVPENSWDENLIVAKNLSDFLRFGLLYGYFTMEQLAYQRELTLDLYSSPIWISTESSHESGEVNIWTELREVFDFLAHELNATPISYTPEVFELLQTQFYPLLEISEEFD